MKVSLKLVAGVASAFVSVLVVTVLTVNLGSRIDDVNNRVVDVNSRVESAVSNLGSQVESVVSFLSTTTTSTTTTTTTTTLPPKPAGPSKTSLVAKVDEWRPGTSSQVSSSLIESGGKMACHMWEAEKTSRMSVMREVAKVMRLAPEELDIAAVVSQAVLYTTCRINTNFPEGPLPFDCMGNGKICD